MILINELTQCSAELNKYKIILMKINIRFIFQITTVYHRLTTQVRQNELVQNINNNNNNHHHHHHHHNNNIKNQDLFQITTVHHGLTTQVRQKKIGQNKHIHCSSKEKLASALIWQPKGKGTNQYIMGTFLKNNNFQGLPLGNKSPAILDHFGPKRKKKRYRRKMIKKYMYVSTFR